MNEDLFENYENLPKNLLDILNKYQMNEDLNYITIEKMLKEVNAIGYTFEYYLDCIPYNLQKLTKKRTKIFFNQPKNF